MVSMSLFAENIDPHEEGAKYGWSENAGWLNLDPDGDLGVQVTSTELTGYIWAENIGWINLSPRFSGPNTTGFHIGVLNTNGILSGLAWGENVGWINFDPDYPGEGIRPNPITRVVILGDGTLKGWAWGENIGWIRFDNTQLWSAKVCKVGIQDLQNFASHWLVQGRSIADLNRRADAADLADFSIFADHWLDYCPDAWQLK